MKSSDELMKAYGVVEWDAIATVRELLLKHGGSHEFDFEDEAGNNVKKIDHENVYFDGTMESYPLAEMGLLDLIYVVGEME